MLRGVSSIADNGLSSQKNTSLRVFAYIDFNTFLASEYL